MSLIDDCNRYIIEDEGEVKKNGMHVAYQDSLGVWTIGNGFNIDGDHQGGLYDDEVDFIRKRRITRIWTELYTKLPWLHHKEDNIKLALFLMAYQLGVRGLLRFKKMLAAVEAGNMKEAILQAHQSKWAKQTPARVTRVVNLLKE